MGMRKLMRTGKTFAIESISHNIFSVFITGTALKGNNLLPLGAFVSFKGSPYFDSNTEEVFLLCFRHLIESRFFFFFLA